ncbi:hypothetical protein XPA_001141 [Xanthoria parietina]
MTIPQAADTHTKNNDTPQNETTKETPTKPVIPNDITSTKEPELIYAVPSSKLKITITLYPHRPVPYASLRSCLKGAHRRAKPPGNRDLPTPNRYLYYPPSNIINNTPPPPRNPSRQRQQHHARPKTASANGHRGAISSGAATNSSGATWHPSSAPCSNGSKGGKRTGRLGWSFRSVLRRKWMGKGGRKGEGRLRRGM